MAILTKNGQLLTSSGSILTANVGGGGSAVIEQLNVSASGTYTASGSVDGFSPVVVPAGAEGTPTATKGTVSNNSITVTPSVTNTSGFIAGGTKNGTGVSVSASELVSGNKPITSNGTGIDVTNYATVSVSVGSSVNVQSSKSYTVSASGSQTISPDTNYDAMEEVALSVPAQTLPTSTSGSATSGYTSKATVSRSTSDQYINIPTGFNSAGAYYKVNAVPNMTLPTSASSTSSGTSKATISRSTADQYINIPTGYNDTASYYKVNAVANGSVTSPATISGSSASVSTGTNTITLSKTVSVTPTVSTAGYVSSGTAGNSAISLTASVTTKAATTYNTSSTDQTIASGTYLTGTQTIKAVTVSGLAANKILSGTTVKIGDANDDDRIASVTGEVTFQTYYTGSGTPASSLGVDGDIFLRTS